jgi:hypothetical protein
MSADSADRFPLDSTSAPAHCLYPAATTLDGAFPDPVPA